MKIRNKILLVVLALSVGSMLIVTVMSYFSMAQLDNSANTVYNYLTDKAGDSSQDALNKLSEEHLKTISTDRAELYNQTFEAINDSIIKYREYIEDVYRQPALFEGHDVRHVTETTEGVLMEKYTLAPGVELSGQVADQLRLLSNLEYIFRPETKSNGTMLNSYLGTTLGVSYRYSSSASYNPLYDARERDWYKNAMSAPGEIVWTSAYTDTIRDIETVLVTCSTAFRDAEGRIAGVFGIDVTVDSLIERIMETQFGTEGYAFLLDNEGRIIAHKDIHKPGFVTSPLQAESAADAYQMVLRDMVAGKSDFERITIAGNEKYIAYSSLPSIGWSIAIVIDVKEVMLPAMEMSEQMAIISKDAQADFQNAILRIVLQFVAIFAVLVAVVLVSSMLLSDLVTRPIKMLAADVKIVGQGNLDHVIVVTTRDEIKDFADAFNAMTRDIKEYIRNLALQTQEKERIESDLRIATDIQADMLPKIFPPFSNRDDIHIATMMQPAKEVGGDFYDFFFLDEEQTRIALVIADVSGKGVPAALFMVIAKVLIKNNKALPADQVLYTVNNLLCADNNSSMFVTTYYSVLDLTTGEYTYASAGHNPPVVYRADDGTADYLTLPRTPPLALFPNKKYPAQTITLKRGDTLMLYTDGVTEAFNTASEMYGSERLLQNISDFAGKPVEDIVAQLHKTIKDFAGEEPQSDDITMLCCRFFGKADLL